MSDWILDAAAIVGIVLFGGVVIEFLGVRAAILVGIGFATGGAVGTLFGYGLHPRARSDRAGVTVLVAVVLAATITVLALAILVYIAIGGSPP